MSMQLIPVGANQHKRVQLLPKLKPATGKRNTDWPDIENILTDEK
jgi:hypothetical protein